MWFFSFPWIFITIILITLFLIIISYLTLVILGGVCYLLTCLHFRRKDKNYTDPEPTKPDPYDVEDDFDTD